MTSAEIIYDIRRIANAGGVPSDDQRLNSNHIIFRVDVLREDRIRKATRSQGGNLDQSFWQHLALEFERVDRADCMPINSGCTIKVSEISEPVTTASGTLLLNITDGVGSQAFPVYDLNTAILAKHRRYEKHKPFFYISGNHIYMEEPVPTMTKYMRAQGVFRHPESVRGCHGNATTCFDRNTDNYPIDGETYSDLLKQFLFTEFRIMGSTKADERNDSRDTPVSFGAQDQIASKSGR